MKKLLILLALAIIMMTDCSFAENSNNAQTSVAYTQADCDRSIRIEAILEQMEKRMGDMNQRMDDMNKHYDESNKSINQRIDDLRVDTKGQFDSLKTAFGWVVTIFLALIIFLIGIVIRDRKVIFPIEQKLNQIDLELKDIKKDTSLNQIMVGLRQLAKTNSQVSEFLKNNNLL